MKTNELKMEIDSAYSAMGLEGEFQNARDLYAWLKTGYINQSQYSILVRYNKEKARELCHWYYNRLEGR